MKDGGQQDLKKINSVLLVALFVIILCFSVISVFLTFFILDAYQSFEINDMTSRMNHFSENLNNSFRNIERTVYDYSVWDDMALFSEGKYNDFPEHGLSSESFQAMDIDIVGIFDTYGHSLFLEDYSVQKSGRYLYRPELETYFNTSCPLYDPELEESGNMHHLVFHTKNLSGILVSNQITYHSKPKQGSGHVVLGRYFNQTYLNELSVFLNQPVQLVDVSETESIFSKSTILNGQPSIAVHIENESTISGYLRVIDPISLEYTTFKITYPRSIYQEGFSALSSYLLLIIGLMGVFAVLTVLGIRYYFRHADSSAKLAKERDYSYQKIIEEIEDAYFKTTPEGRIQFVSPSTAKMLGYSDASELVGRYIFEMYQNPDDRNKLSMLLFSKEELRDQPVVLKRKDGSLIFISANVHLIYDEHHNVIGIEGIAHDNTDNLLIKKATQENESFYRLIFESANIGLFQTNSQGGVLLVNPALASMLGYISPEEMREEITDLVQDLHLDPDEYAMLVNLLNIHGEVRNMEFSLKKADGTPIWLNCNVVAIKDIYEKTATYFGTAIDISEKKIIELELIESRQKFQSLFYFSPVAIIVYTNRGEMVDLNSTAISLFGLSEHSIPESYPPFYLEYLTSSQTEDLEAGKVVSMDIKMDFSLLRSKFEVPATITGIGYFNMIITPVPNKESGEGWLFVLITDITKRKIAEIARNIAIGRLKEAEKIASLGHWDLDHRTNSLYWSESVYQIFEKSPFDFTPSYSSFLSLVHPGDRTMVDNAFWSHVHNHEPFDVVHRILLSDGRIKFVREVSKTDYHPEGTPQKSVGIIHDITSIKFSELALRESELKYRQMFANVSLGLVLFEFTPDGIPGLIIDANPKAEEMIHKSLNEILEMKGEIRSFIPFCDTIHISDLKVSSSDICVFESDLNRDDDKNLIVHVIMDIYRLADKVVGLAIIEDITEKRHYEEERVNLIAQIEKNLAELAILNDGIRNPLTIITMVANELENETLFSVLHQVQIIDELVSQLDKRWLESDKILRYLQKYHNVHYKKDIGR
jgi:PAS domain S-box-containing protein